MATGVLALVVGRATRLAQFLSGHEKKYVARIRLGMSTDSWDRTGAIVSQLEPGVPLPGWDDVATVLCGCLGEQEQVPPAFSAKKLGGVPAYELARRGRAVEMTAARVTLHHAAVEAFSAPFVDVRLTCSAGFYVRALADALGKRLGCGACLDALCRTASGPFTLERAIPLARLEEAPDGAVGRLVPPEQALPGMPTVVLTGDGVRRALHGNEVGPGDWIEQVPSVERRVPSARSRHPELGTRNRFCETPGTRRPTPGHRPAFQRAGSFASSRRSWGKILNLLN